jgi:hypothetical protein
MTRAVLLLTIALTAPPAARPQTTKPSTTADQLPPISYICPMAQDAEVVEDQPGKCRKCGMNLEPARLDAVWTCPVHAAVIRDKSGKCPIDGRDLIQVTMVLTWTCRGTDVKSVNPGACANGSPMVKSYAPRPHGNHNPQHGGQFFMAPDNWHHLEGAFVRPGVFRLYLYDDYTKPLPLDQVRKIRARVVTDQTFDAAARAPTENKAFALVRKNRYLEATIGSMAFPAKMQARVNFQADAPEHVFDFSFDAFSTEAAAAAPRTTSVAPGTMPSAPPAPPSAARAGAASTSSAPEVGSGAVLIPSGVDPALIPLPIPETVPEMLAQLRTRTAQIKGFIDKGAFADVYVPAFQAKDLALALAAREDQLAPEQRKIAEPAIAKLVRSAYLLDAFGDLGNKQQIAAAYVQFEAAAKDIESAFPRQ